MKSPTWAALLFAAFSLGCGADDLIFVSTGEGADTVSVTPDELSIEVGDTVTVLAVPVNALGQPVPVTVGWSSSAPTVASVTSDGLVTGVAAGQATIFAIADSVAADVTVTVSAGAPPPPPPVPAGR